MSTPPRAVSVETVRPLRALVLRPGRPAAETVFPGDERRETLHAAVLDRGEALGVASVIRDPYPPVPGAADWRIRGMATLPAARGRGIGAALLAMCEQHARASGGERLWCNARIGARRFYERAGFMAQGAQFDIPGIGVHVLMCKLLER